MDIRKAIEKLNTIDAKDLKKIDLSKFKEYNIDRFKQDLSTKPKLLINTILVGLTLMSFLLSLNFYRSGSSKIKKEMEELTKKHEIMLATKAIEDEYKNFFDNLPEIIPNNQLIGKISEFAEKTHVNIMSFSPLNALESEYVSQHNVNLSVEAKTYTDALNFIGILEDSGYTLKIKQLLIRSKFAFSQMGDYKGEDEVPIDITVEIISITLKNV